MPGRTSVTIRHELIGGSALPVNLVSVSMIGLGNLSVCTAAVLTNKRIDR